MRSVSELTRVDLHKWVKVRRASGKVVIGQVVAHDPVHPSRHTVQTANGVVVVDLPSDVLVKMSNRKFNPPKSSTPVYEYPVKDGSPSPWVILTIAATMFLVGVALIYGGIR